MPDGHDVLSWLHIGDLHVTQETEQNYLDPKRIVDLAMGLPAGSVDFAVLPGDNAEDGTAEQFRLARDAVAPLPMPLHILPGDHDFKSRGLDGLHDVLGAERLPKAVLVQRHRCLFVVSAETGGETSAWARRSSPGPSVSWSKPRQQARTRSCSCTPTRRIYARAPRG
jgi:hypothetical protein